MCFAARQAGPVKMTPGKTLATFIKEAFQEELFLVKAYDSKAPVKIEGRIERMSFSSVSPENWKIALRVSSNKFIGYTVAVKCRHALVLMLGSRVKTLRAHFLQQL